MKLTYNSCGICGHQPNEHKSMNVVRRWWSPDDGWKIGALCHPCWDDAKGDRPKPEDYAYADHRTDCCTDEPETDEDTTCALDDGPDPVADADLMNPEPVY